MSHELQAQYENCIDQLFSLNEQLEELKAKEAWGEIANSNYKEVFARVRELG